MKSPIFPGVAGLLDSLARSSEETHDLPATMYQIVETARAQLDASGCVIYGLNPVTRHPFAPAISAAPAYRDDLTRVLCSEHHVREILARGTLLIEDRGQGSGAEETLTLLRDLPTMQTLVALPLRVRRRHQKSFGLLFLLYQQRQAFTPADHELFQVFADQISVVLESAWLQERYREVARIGQDINHGLADIDSLVSKLQHHVSLLLDEESALLLIVYHPQSRTLDRYHAQEKHLIVDAGREFVGACRHVIETRKLLVISHRSKDAQNLPFRFVSIQGTMAQESFIFVPLLLHDEALGVLSIQHPEPDAYTSEDRFILELLANHVALALYNARLYRSLSQLNETGQLLTQQFEAVSTPQTIVDSIKGATQADLVVLYSYDMAARRFVGPPCRAGQLLQPLFPQTAFSSSEGIALRILEQREAIFAEKSALLSTWLPGDTALPESQRFSAREQICSTAAIPLHVKEQTMGVLFVNFRQPQHFDESQRLLIGGLAHYAAIAIKNSQIFERLNERRIHDLETLQKIDSVLNTTFLEISEVLDAILRLAHERVPADRSSVLLYNAHRRYFTSDAVHGLGAEVRTTRRIVVNRTDRGIVRWVVNHGQAAVVRNVHDIPWCEIYLQANEETVSELDVPLMDEDRVIGVLNFESEVEDAFRQEDLLFLETLAGQAVLAVKKAQAYEREKRFAERFRLLYEAGQALGKITETQQIDTAYATIVRLALELSQSPVALRRYDEETQELVLVANSPCRSFPPSLKLGVHDSFNGRVARERRTLVVDDIEQWSPGSVPADRTIKSFLIAPITFKNRYYGNLELTHHRAAHFHDTDQEFFEGLAQQLASTLYRLEITQERQELAQRTKEAETMASIGQAAYEITHRIGNDLGLVGAYTSRVRKNMLSTQVNGASVCENLAYIDEAVGRVMNLSESLRAELSIWRESDHFILLPPSVLLQEALGAVPLPENIQTQCEVAADVAPVSVIHALIMDTLRNLVINAKEAMSGGGKLTLCARNRGRSVSLEVSDTGAGIPSEHLGHIFDLFFSTKDHGSGFGLWSAQRNALKNRGKLEVFSQVNQGTTFALLLPRAGEPI
jgi:GAF domain-containing protein